MCVQVPCVYILHTASAVTMQNSNKAVMHDVNMYHAVVFARLGLPELACQSVQVSVLRDGFSDTVLRSQEVIYFLLQESKDDLLRFSKVNTVLSFFESTFFYVYQSIKSV